MRKIGKVLLLVSLVALEAFGQKEDEPKIYDQNSIKADSKVPYKRPIGFTYNLIAMTSMTFEGRFFVGLLPHITLALSPSYQNTPKLPLFHPFEKNWNPMDFKRFNLGVGIRGHFYQYDSWDGWYLEGMVRPGMTWLGDDDMSWSVIPSLMGGYQTVYESGFTMNIGFGFEWEFLFGQGGNHAKRDWLETAYFGITKVPLTGELSVGYTW